MLRPNTPEWDSLFDNTVIWEFVRVEPHCTSAGFDHARRSFPDEVFTESSLHSEIVSRLQKGISGPVCFRLVPGVHELHNVSIDSVFPVIFSAADPDPDLATSSLVVVVVSSEANPAFTVSGPGGVLFEGIAFVGSNGCVCVKEGPAKLTNCTFRLESAASCSVTISHHASVDQCLFDGGGVGIAIRAPCHKSSVDPDFEVTISDTYFRTDKLRDAIRSTGNVLLRLSNLAFEGISGCGLYVGGSGCGYLRRSLLTDICGTGVVIDDTSSISVTQCKFRNCSAGVGDSNERLAGAVVLVRGRSTPRIEQNYIYDSSSDKHSIERASATVKARCLVVFGERSAPTFSDNKVADRGGVSVAQTLMLSLVGVCDDSMAIITNNTFTLSPQVSYGIVLAGACCAEVSNNRFERKVHVSTPSGHITPPLALGPSQRSQCSNNVLFFNIPESQSTLQPPSSVYLALDTDPKSLAAAMLGGARVASPGASSATCSPFRFHRRKSGSAATQREMSPRLATQLKTIRKSPDHEREVAYLNSVISQLRARLRLKGLDSHATANNPQSPKEGAPTTRARVARPPGSSPPRKLTGYEQMSLSHRLYTEGRERHEEAMLLARQRVLADESAVLQCSPRRALLSASEVRDSNQRLYYEQVEHKKEVLEALRSQYDSAISTPETSLKEESKESRARTPLSPRPPRIVRSQSDIEMYAASLHKGHKDAAASRKAAVIVCARSNSGPLHVFERREKTPEEIYPSLQRRPIKKTKQELELLGERLYRGAPK